MACPHTGMERAGRAVLFKEVRSIIARAVCAWAGISHGVDGRRVCECSEMSQSTGSIGPAELAGAAPARPVGVQGARRIPPRSGPDHFTYSTMRAIISRHREPDGKLLDVSLAS